MAFVKKTWKERISEYPSRRDLMDISTGLLYKTVNVLRNEGNVSQEGDGFTKTNMNNLENRIDNAFKEEHHVLIGTLAANATYIDFTDQVRIVDGCIPHVFVPFDKLHMVPESIEFIGEHTLRITFPAQITQTVIKVKIEMPSNNS